MTNGQSEIRSITARRTQRGSICGFIVEVRHRGLNELRTVGDRDRDTAIRKAEAICARWDEKWTRIQQQTSVQQQKQASKEQAEAQTAVAEQELAAGATILRDAVGNRGPLHWGALEDRRSFRFGETGNYPLLKFAKDGPPIGIKPIEVPPQPRATDSQFGPRLTWLDKLWSPSRSRKEEAAAERFDKAHREWQAAKDTADDLQHQAEHQLSDANTQFKAKELEFKSTQEYSNAQLADFKRKYESKEPEAIVRYCELVLSVSRYPGFVGPEYDVSYNPANATAVIECELPDTDSIPTLVKVTYTASSRDFKEKHTTDNDRDKLFDLVLYQIALRTIYELFQADTANALASVVFNGWVDALNQRPEASPWLPSLGPSRKERDRRNRP